ncbi:ABC transporter ATP-binding protein [Oceanisphaera ostreae]|uniref:ABC transporter ATP-binding protein n=1 Tax=Oceanisphaera ostreae TaxID=914151 RepID=A0ABW3KHU8_9GAMM
MIEFNNISFRYPGSNSGVNDINLTINKGELLAILGQSGSGKTTLLKLIAGFEKPDSGIIRVNNKDITPLSCQQRNLGIVFQDYALFPHMTVLENIAYPLKLKNIDKDSRLARAAAMVQKTGLSGKEQMRPANLSGGQQQRVALARALIFEPSALLLDEPLSALDAGLREDMRQEIRQLQQQLGITTILITHDQEEAMSMADQVAVMKNGRLLQVDRPANLYHKPKTVDVAQFVGRANILPAIALEADRIECALGQLQVHAPELKAGQQLHIMIRPEHWSPIAGEHNTFAVEHLNTVFWGPTCQATVMINGTTIKAEGQLHTPPTNLSIHPEHIHLIS